MKIKIEQIIIGQKFGYLLFNICGNIQMVEVSSDEAKQMLSEIQETNAKVTAFDSERNDILVVYKVS